jgi:membrane fusion protein, multidrug efflux system
MCRPPRRAGLSPPMPSPFIWWTRSRLVDAQPKETEMTYVRPGQPTTVTVDTYPGLEARRRREHQSRRIAGVFAASLENTSGNWVKVVQRIPMRIKLETNPFGDPD